MSTEHGLAVFFETFELFIFSISLLKLHREPILLYVQYQGFILNRSISSVNNAIKHSSLQISRPVSILRSSF